ncbi:hypothetical protein PHJA_002404800 [Phtheirospermum japonicum]|uniref:Uncharacterized protein n=1 Tax=Phtheirospermum japonicum TaxID=374723 RepID=A0A830CPY7_9LAMI|nr:hypothetical protein PHJA_002404800 [Phtheirospermum japonicum]
MWWRDETNQHDCAIYAMHHMETYMGEGVRGCKCGFKTKAPMQMLYLRAQYCATILTSVNNIHANRNKESALLHYRLACEDGEIDMVQLLDDYLCDVDVDEV